MQGLGEAHAATFNTWRKLSRPVKRGEKGRFILRPRFAKTVADGEGEEKQLIGFSCLTVFGLTQTEGAEFAVLQPQDFLAPDTFAQSVGTLREVALTLPHVSTVEVRERRPGDAPGAYGWFNRATKAIIVLSDTTPAQQFATLVHELAHALLHGGEAHHDAAVKEVEAESTSFVVCQALGLDTGPFSFPYVAHWAGPKAPTVAVATAGENIRRASSRILEALLPSENRDDAAEAE
jgi:antirestriction protein ArdC